MDSGKDLWAKVKIGARGATGRVRASVDNLLHPAATPLKNTDTPAEKKPSLEELRKKNLTDPRFDILDENLQFQKWKNNKDNPNNTTFPSEKSTIFSDIDAGKVGVGNPLASLLNEIIDPSLSREELHKACIDYCKNAGTSFIENARAIAQAMTVVDPDNYIDRTHAIVDLMGETTFGGPINKNTIFPDQEWNVSSYRTVFDRLGVTYDDAGVDKKKIMAGIDVCLGLWTQLADLGQKRPSGKPFGPPLDSSSFQSLIIESGWAKERGINTKELLLNSNKELGESFLNQFRKPKYFEGPLKILAENKPVS